MEDVNEFNENGDFVLWQDRVRGTEVYRYGFVPKALVWALVDWIVIQERALKYFPQLDISRETWSAILTAIPRGELDEYAAARRSKHQRVQVQPEAYQRLPPHDDQGEP